MYLKSLTLKGFKSFADKSVVTVEPGVTCVVGPNGSGKSNISDAVLWVLGEQSAKTLRGSAMEDIIFSGSSGRRAVGVAEVDLVLDNSDGLIPLEFNEITFSRRMYRSGESEYLINQSPARLADIQDILHDTGLGRDAHSIISQGRLTEVLEAKPLERRALIEEAAGVLKHKKRKEKALRKLAGLDTHLERANDILLEIERQLKPLLKQADKARTHAEIVAELKDLEIALAVDDLRTLQQDWEAVIKIEKEAEGELSVARYHVEESERELEKLQRLFEEKGLYVGDISEQRRRVQSIAERLDAGLLLLEEKGKNLINRLSELRMQLHGAQSRIGAAVQERDDVSLRRAETAAALQQLYTQLGELRLESESLRKARMATDAELARATSLMRSQRTRLDESRDKINRAQAAASSLTIQHDLLETRLRELSLQNDSSQENLSQRRAKLDGLDREIAKTNREIALADNDVDKRVRVLDTRRKELDEARAVFSAARAEIKGLREIDRASVSSSPALERLLKQDTKPEGFLGAIRDRIQANEGYEAITERLLGSDIFGVFVADVAGALNVAHDIKGSSAGDIVIIPVDGEVQKLPTSTVGVRLLDVLDFEGDVAGGVDALLGDAYIVDSLQSAIAAHANYPGIRFAAKDGSIVWASGKITLGEPVVDTEGTLVRKRRMNLLTDNIDSLEASVASAEAALSIAEEALIFAQQDALGLNQRLAQTTGERDSLLEEIGRQEQSLSRLTQERDELSKKLAEAEKSLAAQAPAIEEYEADIAQLEAALAEAQAEQETQEYDRGIKIREETRATEALSKCQVEIATVSEREIHLKRELTTLIAEVDQLERTIAWGETSESAFETLRERLEPLHALYVDMQNKAEYWTLMLRDRAKLEQSDAESLRKTISDARDAIKAAGAVAAEKAEATTEVRITKGQLEVKVNAAVRRIVEEMGMPIERALSLPSIEDRLSSEDRALALRRRMSNLGAVNPVAREEFEALSSRRDFMRTQMDDLDTARKALNKVVAAIDRKIKTLFLSTFEEVDTHYQRLFALLFPGGNAQLELTDPDNPDETGVEFNAQPRGKKIRKMSLLSGGERSLASLALLFAVYSVRPTPFFILDEVEQALDDSNLHRFVSFINTMRNNTQFLIITHQRKTMEMADVLYGVSMQADGVSKLVSQKL